jgi:hypothetical protein
MIQLLLMAVVMAAPPSAASVSLFELGRSKNANVVVYAARVGPDGLLDPSKPFEAHWSMRAEDGRMEPLNLVEEMLAYGFSWTARRPGHAYSLTMTALRDRRLEVIPHGGGYQVITSIGGKAAVLVRVFVTADDAPGLPNVKSVDLFGVTVADGSPAHEVILPPARKTSRPVARRDEAL